jgi:hypothetical protein
MGTSAGCESDGPAEEHPAATPSDATMRNGLMVVSSSETETSYSPSRIRWFRRAPCEEGRHMRRLPFGGGALVLCAAVAVLGGCTGGIGSSPSVGSGNASAPFGSGLTSLSAARLAAMTMPHYVARPAHPDRGESWITHGSVGKELFYVSDWATDDVYVYSYPSAKRVGILTGFEKPYGQCADTAGNIWIADFEASSIVEYAHGGTAPIATLATNGNTMGCAVARNGDLAVANFATASGPGDVQVFKNASGTPADYSNTTCYNLWAPGYDKKGNLYVEGKNTTAAVCELRAGGSVLRSVSIDQTIGSPGSVMWDGTYITLTDQDYDATQTTAIYRAKESKSGDLTVVGTTDLTDTCDGNYADVPQPFLLGSRNTPDLKYEATLVLGGNVLCTGRFDYWAYPMPSGNPIIVIKHAPAQPYGQGYSTIAHLK